MRNLERSVTVYKIVIKDNIYIKSPGTPVLFPFPSVLKFDALCEYKQILGSKKRRYFDSAVHEHILLFVSVGLGLLDA